MVAIHEEVTGDRGMRIGKVGQHKYFGIMEDVTTISKTRQAFGSNAIAFIV